MTNPPEDSGAGISSDTVSISGCSNDGSSALPPISLFIAASDPAASDGCMEAKAPMRLESLVTKPRSAAPATSAQAAPAMQVTRTQRLGGAERLLKGLWRCLLKCRTRTGRLTTLATATSFPVSFPARLIKSSFPSLCRSFQLGGHSLITPCVPIQCEARSPNSVILQPPESCPETARNLPSARTGV